MTAVASLLSPLLLPPYPQRTHLSRQRALSASSPLLASSFASLPSPFPRHSPRPPSSAFPTLPPSESRLFSGPATRSLAVPALSRRSAMRSGLLGLLGGWLPGLFGNSTTVASAASGKKSAVEEALDKAEFPEQFPFRPEDFQRYDESPDAVFYSVPRFVTHIDDYAIKALTKYYETALPPANSPGAAVLDLCSSWICHYPKNYKQERIVGLGMNEDELARNPVLTEYVVQDLNANAKLPFEDNSFDAITNAVSVDYLNKPLEVFKEMNRVLKPGGLAAMSFSNRCFWTKAISIWTSTGDLDHCLIVGAYFHYAGGFERPKALDISPNPGRTDPMYVVYARKLSA